MNEEQIKQKFLQETQDALSNKKCITIGSGIIILGIFSTVAISALMAGLAIAITLYLSDEHITLSQSGSVSSVIDQPSIAKDYKFNF